MGSSSSTITGRSGAGGADAPVPHEHVSKDTVVRRKLESATKTGVLNLSDLVGIMKSNLI